MKKKLLLLIIILCFFRSFSQVRAYTDTNVIKIAEQFNFFIEIESGYEDKINFFIPKDTVNKFEIISFKIDTIKDEKIKYIEAIRLTGFTQGSFYLEPIEIKINEDSYFTNRIPVVVDGVQVDTTKPFFDIRKIIEIPYTLFEILQFLFCVIIILLILYALYFFLFIRKKDKKDKIHIKKEIIPPYVLAKKNIQLLKQKKLLENEKYKDFYTELTDILRAYLEGEFGIDAMEYTTNQIIKEIKDNISLERKMIEDLRKMLENADLVKFAKSVPIISDAKEDIDFVDFFIEELNSKLKKNTNIENGQ